MGSDIGVEVGEIEGGGLKGESPIVLSDEVEIRKLIMMGKNRKKKIALVFYERGIREAEQEEIYNI